MKDKTKWQYTTAILVIAMFGLVLYVTNPNLFAVTPPMPDPTDHECPAGQTWDNVRDICVSIIPNYGEQATIEFNCFDQELDTVAEVTVNASIFRVGESTPIKEKGKWDTSSTLTAAVGERLNFYPIYTSSALYYGDPVLDLLVDKENMYVSVNCYNATTAGAVNATAYENDGVTELTPGGSYAQNFTFPIGAGETDQFFIKVKNIHKDDVYWFCGFAWNYTDNITDVEILDAGWAKDSVPQHLTAYDLDEIWTHDVIELHEWDWQKFEFSVEAGSTDPITDEIYILIKDCAYYEKVDKTIGFGYADDTPDEADVGMTDAIASEVVILTAT
jgi:hypothetical protein